MDFALREKAYCSHEEKLSCLDTVFKILRYTNIARSYGLLALEEETKAEKNPLLIKGIALITSGTDIDMVKRILRNYITFSNDEGVDLLNHLIIAEGIRLIQQGENPALMKTALLSYLGFEGEALYAEYKEPNESALEDLFQDYYKQLHTIVPTQKENQRLIHYIATPPHCFPLLLKLDPIVLARAICCWDGRRQIQILAYLPYSRVKRIVQEMNGIPQENRNELAMRSQESLLRSIDKLIESGEIIA